MIPQLGPGRFGQLIQVFAFEGAFNATPTLDRAFLGELEAKRSLVLRLSHAR